MGILPARPLRIDEAELARRRRKVYLAVALFALFGGAMGWSGVVQLREVREERALWGRGAEASGVSATGNAVAHEYVGVALYYEYVLEVDWADAAGTGHHAPVKFDTFWAAVDTGGAPSLRYDPQDPGRVVLSWQVQRPHARAGFIYLSIGAVALFAAAAWGTVRRDRQRAAAARLVAEDGEEVLVEILSAREYKGQWTVKARLDAGLSGAPLEFTHQDVAGPLRVLREGRPLALALRSPRAPDSPLLVAEDLKPFLFEEDERRTILAATVG